MKLPIDNLMGWISLLRWHLHSSRWLVLSALITMLVALPTAYFWKAQAATLALEQERVTAKAKLASSKENRKKQIERTAERSSTKASSTFSPDQARTEESLKLPSFSKVKAAPLADYLSDSKIRGLQIKQLDYVWAKGNSATSSDKRVGRLDVNLSLTGSYTSIRKWLGDLLVEAPHLQITVLQMQRVSRDSPLVNTAITLAVFYEDGK